MKKYISLSVLLITLLAAGAYAQAEGDPVKEQAKEQTKEQTREQVKDQPQEQAQVQTKEQLKVQTQVQTKEQLKVQTQVQTKEQLKVQTRENCQTLDVDKNGGQNQQMNYGGGEGETHELGDKPRNGEDFTGQGSPQGPLDSGPMDDFLKISGENADGAFAGDMMRYGWGPGDSTLDGPFGPNDGTGHGPGGRDAADGEDPVKGGKGQARAGRR